MVDIDNLLRSLPISGLEPQTVGLISGITHLPPDKDWAESLSLVEPPAGQRVPFIDPIKTWAQLFRFHGKTKESALSDAVAAYAALGAKLTERQRVRFYDSVDLESPEFIPAPALVDFTARHALVPCAISQYLESTLTLIQRETLFHGPENRGAPWHLDDLPDQPPPMAMIEFCPGGPSNEGAGLTAPGLEWRGRIRPIAEQIERKTGEAVYYFADLDDELDDDSVHRYLVLHWCCTTKPESQYVRYLVKVSGASDVAELLRALENPESYHHPYKMNDAFLGLEASICRFRYCG